jgi:hypothetical protein
MIPQKTVLDNPSALDTLCKIVAEKTDQNDHTGAKLVIAYHFGMKAYARVFEAIKVIHDFEGSMPIGEYRAIVGKRMLAEIRQNYGEDVYEKIWKAL